MKTKLTPFRVVISPKAEKQLRKIGKTDQIILARKIRLLSLSPRITGEEKLSGFKNVYRIRIGSYRIVYKRAVSVVYIILIGHRRDIYQLLKQLLG
jgi:mRNA interferase RelE/StbE